MGLQVNTNRIFNAEIPMCPVFVFQGLNYVSWPDSNLQATLFIPPSRTPTPCPSLSTLQTVNRPGPALLLAAPVPELRGGDMCSLSLRRKISMLGEPNPCPCLSLPPAPPSNYNTVENLFSAKHHLDICNITCRPSKMINLKTSLLFGQTLN